MALNEELIEARIRDINDAAEMLRYLTAKEFTVFTLHERLSMRYLVIQLVEAASSICTQILLALFNEAPESFPECFARLERKEVIPADLTSKLSAAARLRNLLVHRYWEIDDKKIYESVKFGLRDFEIFTIHIRRLLTRKRKT